MAVKDLTNCPLDDTADLAVRELPGRVGEALKDAKFLQRHPQIATYNDQSGGGGTSNVSITNFADLPLGLEIGSATAFCVYDANDVFIGKTFLVTAVDEDTGAKTHEQIFLSTAPNSQGVPWADQGIARECGSCEGSGDGLQGFQGV